MGSLRFYLDENVPLAVAEQLALRGVDVVTVRALGLLGGSDTDHLANATAMGRVLCTQDMDFVQLASRGVSHAGIIIGIGRRHGVGDWVKSVHRLFTRLQSEDFVNRVEYL